MKHIWSVQRDDGTYPEVGMAEGRGVLTGSLTWARCKVRGYAACYKHPVRLESWSDSDFYRCVAPSNVVYVHP